MIIYFIAEARETFGMKLRNNTSVSCPSDQFTFQYSTFDTVFFIWVCQAYMIFKCLKEQQSRVNDVLI